MSHSASNPGPSNQPHSDGGSSVSIKASHLPCAVTCINRAGRMLPRRQNLKHDGFSLIHFVIASEAKQSSAASEARWIAASLRSSQ